MIVDLPLVETSVREETGGGDIRGDHGTRRGLKVLLPMRGRGTPLGVGELVRFWESQFSSKNVWFARKKTRRNRFLSQARGTFSEYPGGARL